VFFKISIDGGLKVDDEFEYTASDAPTCEDGEEILGGVEP
jgi:hypothetical protein